MKRKTHIVRQAERLRRGEINRRRFIMSAMATGVTLPTATSLAQKAEAAQPKMGGTLRYGIATPDRLADARAVAMGNRLLTIAPDQSLVGDLAQRFGTPDSGRTWIFDLHPDASFHSGEPVGALEVVASLSARNTPGLQGQIESLRTDGPRRVIIELVYPNPDFAWVLTDPALVITNEKGLGSGAYRPAADERRLHKVSDHWKTNSGHFDTLDLIALPDPSMRLTALLNDELDLIDDVDPRMVGLLQRAPDIALAETEETSLLGLVRQSGTDARAGRALSDATDRRDLAQKVLLGHGRANECTRCDVKAQIEAPIAIGTDPHAFPGAGEFVDLIAKAAQKTGLPVTTNASAQFGAERLRLRPTLDWTLAELWARRPGPELAELVHKARTSTSIDEKSALQKSAVQVLENAGDIFPLVANDIHAHHARLERPKGAFDPVQIVTRGWLA